MRFELYLPEDKLYDEEREKFVQFSAKRVELEHSLRTIAEWESKWEIPFLSKNTELTPTQISDYIVTMSRGGLTREDIFRFTEEQIDDIGKFLNAKGSATWFSDSPSGGANGNAVTAEVVYYWMTAYSIPFDAEKWPINRLMNLIRICTIKAEQADPKKRKRRMSGSILSERAALNAKRRAQEGHTG